MRTASKRNKLTNRGRPVAISKQEQHGLEIAVFNQRGEAGLVKMREWLYDQQARVNREWPNAIGDEVLKLQGEAKLLQRIVKMLEQGPTIKQLEAAQ